MQDGNQEIYMGEHLVVKCTSHSTDDEGLRPVVLRWFHNVSRYNGPQTDRYEMQYWYNNLPAQRTAHHTHRAGRS